MGVVGRGEGEEATQHHIKAGEEKKSHALENWKCMCEFNCTLLLMYLFIYLFILWLVRCYVVVPIAKLEGCVFCFLLNVPKTPKPVTSPPV